MTYQIGQKLNHLPKITPHYNPNGKLKSTNVSSQAFQAFRKQRLATDRKLKITCGTQQFPKWDRNATKLHMRN